MSNCMFCNSEGEWAFALFGEVCQYHWENPHSAETLSAELAALCVELEAARAVILRYALQAQEAVTAAAKGE